MGKQVEEVTPSSVAKVRATQPVTDFILPARLVELVEKHFVEVKSFLREAQSLGVRVCSYSKENQLDVYVVTTGGETVVCLGEELS
jgi:hypothetical protein